VIVADEDGGGGGGDDAHHRLAEYRLAKLKQQGVAERSKVTHQRVAHQAEDCHQGKALPE